MNIGINSFDNRDLNELSKVWNNLSDNMREVIAEAIGGKHSLGTIESIMYELNKDNDVLYSPFPPGSLELTPLNTCDVLPKEYLDKLSYINDNPRKYIKENTDNIEEFFKSNPSKIKIENILKVNPKKDE